MQTQRAQRIENSVLNKIIKLSYKYLIKPNTQNKILLIKLYENDKQIIYQLKHSHTKRSCRFIIDKEPKDELAFTLVFRSRDPNTIEFFEDFFSIKETFEIHENEDWTPYFLKSNEYLYLPNIFSKSKSEVKIKTTLIKEELNEENLLLKYVDNVETNDQEYLIHFIGDDEVFKINRDRHFKLPFNNDIMVRDIKGKFQFYSQAKARYHFIFKQTTRNYHGI